MRARAEHDERSGEGEPCGPPPSAQPTRTLITHLHLHDWFMAPGV